MNSKQNESPPQSGFSLLDAMGAIGLVTDGSVARFIEPIECLPVEQIPEGNFWTYELKLDGYRLVAVKTRDRVTLYSRDGN